MKFAQWLRGEAQILLADVTKVFVVANAAVAVLPLPLGVKATATALITGAQAALTGLEGLAGTEAGQAMGDAVDDVTTLLMNTAGAIGKAKSPAEFGAAEKTVLHATWVAMKAQGDTLMAQFMAGIDPVNPAPEQAKPSVTVTIPGVNAGPGQPG